MIWHLYIALGLISLRPARAAPIGAPGPGTVNAVARPPPGKDPAHIAASQRRGTHGIVAYLGRILT